MTIETMKSELHDLRDEIRSRNAGGPRLARYSTWTMRDLEDRIAYLERRARLEEYLEYRRRRLEQQVEPDIGGLRF